MQIFFIFILLISNHTVFLIQFGINLHLWVFQKAEIARAAFSFLTKKLMSIVMSNNALNLPDASLNLILKEH